MSTTIHAENDKTAQKKNAEITTNKADLELTSILGTQGYGCASRQPAAPNKDDKSFGAGGTIIDIEKVCKLDKTTKMLEQNGKLPAVELIKLLSENLPQETKDS